MRTLPSTDGLKVVTMPVRFRPRDYQMPVWDYMVNRDGKRAILIWPRRHGKDMTALNIMVYKALFHRVGTYFYFLPEATHGDKVIWSGIDGQGHRFLDAIPDQIVYSRRNDLKQITFLHPDCLEPGYKGDPKPGSVFQVLGADPDRIVGTNPIGCVMSEYSLMNPKFLSYLAPVMRENDGWMLFIYTPRGMNHGYDIYARNKANPNWHVELKTIHDMQHNGEPIITDAMVEEIVASGEIAEDLAPQEFYCSFEAAMSGSFYGTILSKMADNGQFTVIPYDPDYPVDTAWDLGYNDQMVCIFYQQIRGETRIIDVYDNSGEKFDHYLQVLREKGYTYGTHYFPHDIRSHHYTTATSGIDVLRRHNIKNFQVIPKTSNILDGIDAVRRMLQTTYINTKNCDILIRALKQYRKKELKCVSYDNKPMFSDKPVEDWDNHFADAVRTMAVAVTNKKRYSINRARQNRRAKYVSPLERG